MKLKYRITHLIRSLEEEEKKDIIIRRMGYRINHLVTSLSELDGSNVE